MLRRLGSRALVGLFSVNHNGFVAVAVLLMIVETVLSNLVIEKVKYTEIDWSTYMQQVECYVKKGIMNYTRIGGNTGPVVYPAGHIWVYRVLYSLTDSGRDIRTAQHIFQAFYLLNLVFVFRILYKTMRIPPIVLFLVTVTGYRIHSIFMLRLFNDPLAMLLFYVALDQILDDNWTIGCVFYSLAVSIKMNVLLFAPALFFTLLLNNGILHTIGYIGICGIIQLYVGGPFLVHDWRSYVQRSFDLGRVFMFKWTVNWRFLPEDFFLDKRFHVALLVGHLTVLALFAWYMWFRQSNGIRRSVHMLLVDGIHTETSEFDTMFAFSTSNLIGIAFSRSLHYQFYSWYFHQLPFLLFSNYPRVTTVSDIPWKTFFWKVPLLLAVELSWNVYPSTWWSSALLHVCHLIIFIFLICSREPMPSDTVNQQDVQMLRKHIDAVKECVRMNDDVVPKSELPSEDEFIFFQEPRPEPKPSVETKKKKPRKASKQRMREVEEEFEKWWLEQLPVFRNKYKVYRTRDGSKEVSGMSPLRDFDSFKMHEKVSVLYAKSLDIGKEPNDRAAKPSENGVVKNGSSIRNGTASWPSKSVSMTSSAIRRRSIPCRED